MPHNTIYLDALYTVWVIYGIYFLCSMTLYDATYLDFVWCYVFKSMLFIWITYALLIFLLNDTIYLDAVHLMLDAIFESKIYFPQMIDTLLFSILFNILSKIFLTIYVNAFYTMHMNTVLFI